MDSGQTPGCVTIHGKTDFESRKPDLNLKGWRHEECFLDTLYCVLDF